MCRGIGSCGIVHAMEPLVGAEEERSLASLSASAAAATPPLEQFAEVDDLGGLTCSFHFFRGLQCNLGMYCCALLI